VDEKSKRLLTNIVDKSLNLMRLFCHATAKFITLLLPIALKSRNRFRKTRMLMEYVPYKEPTMIHLDTLSTLVAATLVLLLGRKLVHSVPLLRKYTIPEPVAGGLLAAVALLVL